ncbi:hypothetical protein EDD21DRAFT_408667 [Dissophora ornata]|nr:hypothetical protein EDD21DRAFT_408667 [Dissophora ornata]
MSAYSLEARIIQKKDQLEELSAAGAGIPTPVVEEVRTGQQFLIKLLLVRNNGSTLPPNFPSLRVGRREAINTAGEARAEPEPLTLEITVHLAKSGQIRKGACAKCCHKVGPASPILQLLDPLVPSVTDPVHYSHVDTTTGSITMLAKVVCSSTDHGERGNKDRYIFEFKLKRTSSMPVMHYDGDLSPSTEALEDEGEVISTCFTHPIMCSGHHKAKRTYPPLRPAKVTKAGPTPKIKTIKRHKSAPTIILAPQGVHQGGEPSGGINSAGPMVSQFNSGFPATISFLPDHFSQIPMMGSYPDRTDNGGLHTNDGHGANQQFMPAGQNAFNMTQQHKPSVSEIRPNQGPIRKRTDVIIRGVFFREGIVPFFGFFPAHDIDIVSSTAIVCKAPESSMPGTVDITFSDNMGNNFGNMGQFTYTDDGETELLILKLQLKMTHRALEYMHMEATGQKGNATEILKNIPGLGTSPHSGSSILMMDSVDADKSMMSLDEVEEGILKTLDCLPREVDISMQLDDGSNLLHLSILLGLNRLAIRLVEDGCDLEAQDMYTMTPLMYAVLKGNESIARILVTGGASSSGARTPEEFYELLPRTIEPTPAMCGYLSVSCTRYFGEVSPSAYTLETVREERELTSSKDETPSQGFTPVSSVDAYVSRVKAASPVTDSTITTCDEPSTVSNTNDAVTQLADTIQRVRANHGMPPLDQQDLPPLHTVQTDGSITINTKVIRGSDIADASGHVPQLYTNLNPESGYHSGIYSEVEERLNRLHMAALPSEGVQMVALFKKLPPSSPAPLSLRPMSISPTPLELFRTGDSFAIEIRLTTLESEGQILMPREYLGIRFPYELTKRVGGKPASILTEMTYSLNMSIELGNLSSIESECQSSSSSSSSSAPCSRGDGVQLTGACKACSKYLHEHRKLSPSRKSTLDPSIYPIFQFYVPGGSSSSALPSLTSTMANTNSSGVVELRDGVCEVKVKVNCSSFHHAVQREKVKRVAEQQVQQQQQQQQSSSSEETLVNIPSPESPLNKSLANLPDPGFVFKFELVHPTLNKVVARYETSPISFQTYPRGRV